MAGNVSSIDVGGLAGASTFTPIAILRDADPSAWLVVGNDSLAKGASVRRCKHDGSPCEAVALGIDPVDGATLHAPTRKILVVTRTPALYACNVDGTGCALATIPGTKAWSFGASIVDPAGQKIIKAGCGHIDRCATDGSGCVANATAVAAPLATGACSPYFSLALDEVTNKLVATSTPVVSGAHDVTVVRCEVDGTRCATQTLTGSSSERVHLPLVGIDRANARLVVVAHPDINLKGAPTLFRCNLDATSCVRTVLPTSDDFQPLTLHVGPNEIAMAGRYLDPDYNPDGWQFLVRCALDGSACTREAAIPGGARDGMPSVIEPAADALYVAGRRVENVRHHDVVVRRPYDASSSSERDMTLGPGPIAFTGSALVDVAARKVLTLSTSGYGGPNGVVSRCELDGSACAPVHVPHAVSLLGFSGSYLAVASRTPLSRGANRVSLWRCSRDATGCVEMDLGMVMSSPSSFALDAAGGKVVEVRYGAQIHSCDLATATCTAPTFISIAPGIARGDDAIYYGLRPHVVTDGAHVMMTRANGLIARCTLTGACTVHAAAGALGKPWRSQTALSGGTLYVLKSAAPDADGILELTRCSPTLSSCTHATLLPAGAGHRIHDFSMTVDAARGEILVAVDDELYGRKPTLLTCDLAGTACTVTALGASQAAPAQVMRHPTNGTVLVATRASASSLRPTLLSVASPY